VLCGGHSQAWCQGLSPPTATGSSSGRLQAPHTTLNTQKRAKMIFACELWQVQPPGTRSLKLSTTAPSNTSYCYRRAPRARRLTPSLHTVTVLRCTATMPSPGTACKAAHCAGKRNRTPEFQGRFPTAPAQPRWALSSHLYITQNSFILKVHSPAKLVSLISGRLLQPSDLSEKDKHPGESMVGAYSRPSNIHQCSSSQPCQQRLLRA